MLSESRRLSGPAGDIMLAARLFEQRGVGQDHGEGHRRRGERHARQITTARNKQAVVDAVIDDYVEDLVSVLVWNESRVFGDTAGSLKACIATFRRVVRCERPASHDCCPRRAGHTRDSFDVRAVREMVDCINEQIVVEYAAYHQVEIEFVYEMFCMVIFGLIGLGNQPRYQRRSAHESGGAGPAPRYGAAPTCAYVQPVNIQTVKSRAIVVTNSLLVAVPNRPK